MLLGTGWHLRPALQPPAHRHCRHRLHDHLARSKPAPWSIARPGLHQRNGPTVAAAGSSAESRAEISERLADTDDGGRGTHNGNNGSGGGGGGGGGSGGSSGSDGNFWRLVASIAGGAALVMVYQRYKESSGSPNAVQQGAASPSSPGGSTAGAAAEDERVVLRRLLQEAFADLVKVRARLDELEDVTGIADSAAMDTDPEATPLVGDGGSGEGGAGRRKRRAGGKGPALSSSSAAAGSRQGRHHLGVLAGTLEMGGGLLWAPEDSSVGDLLPAAGVKAGADLTLRMRGGPREGRDAILAECKLSPSTEQFSLKKVLYYLQMAPWLRLALAPFGATGQDTAYTLNPLAGQGLSSMIREGSPLHQRPLGSLVGASLDLNKAWASAGYALQGVEGGGVRTSVLGQALVSASPTLSLGLSLLQHQTSPSASSSSGGPDTPLPGATGATPRGGLLQVATTPRGILTTPRGGFLGTPAWEGGTPRSGGGAAAQGAAAGTLLGAMFAWRPDPDVVVHGWASADGTAVSSNLRRSGVQGLQPEQWGLSLGSYPDGTGSGWAVGLGRSSAVANMMRGPGAAAAPGSSRSSSGGSGGSSNGGDGGGPPNLFELSVQFSAGEGMVVSPGVLCAVQGGHTSLFAGLKTSWDW